MNKLVAANINSHIRCTRRIGCEIYKIHRTAKLMMKLFSQPGIESRQFLVDLHLLAGKHTELNQSNHLKITFPFLCFL